MKGIVNIGHYNNIVLTKRYEDGEILEVAFSRASAGQYYYFIGGVYHGKHDIATTYKLLRESYDVGYKTVNKE